MIDCHLQTQSICINDGTNLVKLMLIENCRVFFFLNEPKLFRRGELSFVQELLQCLITAFLDLLWNDDKFL